MPKAAKAPRAKKSAIRVKDLTVRRPPKGGVLIGLLLPAVQKIR